VLRQVFIGDDRIHRYYLALIIPTTRLVGSYSPRILLLDLSPRLHALDNLGVRRTDVSIGEGGSGLCLRARSMIAGVTFDFGARLSRGRRQPRRESRRP